MASQACCAAVVCSKANWSLSPPSVSAQASSWRSWLPRMVAAWSDMRRSAVSDGSMAGEEVAGDDQPVDVAQGAHPGEHRLERLEVPVDVGDDGEPHGAPEAS